MHVSNLITSYTTQCPLVAIYGVMMYPFFIFSMTSDLFFHLLNAVLCAYEFYVNIPVAMKIFEVTLTDEQARQINILLAGGVLCCLTAVGLSFFQKRGESNIWRIANENYLKSDSLTQELVKAMEAKDSFVSMLSHEIRNPLNALKGSIDYLLQVIKEYEYVQVLKNAKMSGDVLLTLVSNVLDAAKLKSDKMEVNYSETDLIDTVKKVLTINSEKFRAKEILTKVYIDESIPSLLWIDPSRLLQILMNLVSNSIKFTPGGGRINLYFSWCKSHHEKETLLTTFKNIGENGNPENLTRTNQVERNRSSLNVSSIRGESFVFDELNDEDELDHQTKMHLISRHTNQFSNSLSGLLSGGSKNFIGEFWSIRKTYSLNDQNEFRQDDDKKGFLKVQITDTGCGIDELELPKMFGMFSQGAQGARSVHGGTGLGLWICKQLINRMNGDIKVYSKPREGTSFVFYLPVDNHQVQEIAPKRDDLARGKAKALVVDDFSVNRYLHKLLLEQEGVEVVVACNGKEAIEKCKAHSNDPFHFIMMDVHMPEMDGFTATKIIREWENAGNKRKADVYFVTGEYFNEEDVMNRFRHQGGMNDRIKCLRKPLGGDLISRIAAKYK